MLGSREVSVNEMWPCVQFAPSHPLHVMPPRITRNSHRPRASDRTMVDTLNHHWLFPLSTLLPCHHYAEELLIIKRKNSCSEADGKWAGSRETNPRLRSRQNFFLDIPFDRTH